MKKAILLLLLIFPIFCFSQNTDFSSAISFDAGQSIAVELNSAPLYYKTLLPAQGTLKIVVKGRNTGSTSGHLKLEVYDSRQTDLLLSKNLQKTTISPDEEVSDTILISCRAEEMIFFQFSTDATFSFTFSYTMENISESDIESNNTLETAVPFKLDSTFNGAIGHIYAGVMDDADFYTIRISEGGRFEIHMDGVYTGETTGKLEVIFYQMIDGNYLSEEGRKVIETSSATPGQVIKDSLILDCLFLYDGLLYIKVVANSCFTYSLKMGHESKKPNADFTFKKVANQVMFSPVTTDIDGNNFYWRFGTEIMNQRGMKSEENYFETSNSPFPFISMPVGYHMVLLEITNKECSLYDQVVKYISIEGVEDYSPKKASTGGDFNLLISGWRLDSTTKVTLQKGATTLTAKEVIVVQDQTRVTALFDLHLEQTGLYDVIINVPDIEEPFIFENGLEITSLVYPETYAEIVGADIWRTGGSGKLGLMIHNKGSVIASGVVAALIWPKNIEVNFGKGTFTSSTKTGSETVEVDGETFSLPRADYMFIYDSLDRPTPIDSFNMQPFDGYVKYILIPHVPAAGNIEIPFSATSLASIPGKVIFHTYTFKTNQRGSCENPVYSNFNENLTAELIDGMDMVIDQTGVVPLKVLSKTAKIGQKHAGSMASYAGKKFWAWYDGYEFDSDGAMRDWLAETEANNAFALQTATDELGSLIFKQASAKMLDRYKGQVEFINKRLAANPNMSAKLTDKYLDKLNSLPHDQMRRFEALKGIFDETKNLGTLSDKLMKLQMLADDCPEIAPQIEDLIKDLEKELDIRNPKEKESELSNSFDPNMITGPSGIGANRYLNNTDYQTFTISFENLETATAAAQIVNIYDTIDVNKYDLSTFSFGSIGIGDKYFRLPPNRKEFATEKNITQNIPVKVRISGGIDETTGVITWQFVAIDTNTNLLPVLEGFLPPNVTHSEGEGFVRYTVKPKSNLADGTLFENSASIIFDQNEPILTNVWQNTLDIGKPTSGLSATVIQDTIIRLDLNGFDAVSGIGYYDLFVKINNSPWVSFGGTSLDSLLLIGEPDSTYSFYIKSSDKVGNTEDKDPIAEAIVTLRGPLAVLFGRLTAQNTGENTNSLQWNTFDEDPDDYFVIERSSNGTDFIGIYQVNAKGGPSVYDHLDSDPIQGNNYYRIKIVNNNGMISYSNTVIIKNGKKSVIQVFPNPVSGTLSVQIPGSINQSEKLLLYNSFGQKVGEQRITSNLVLIEMTHLSTGLYHLVYKNKEGKAERFKIVKK